MKRETAAFVAKSHERLEKACHIHRRIDPTNSRAGIDTGMTKQLPAVFPSGAVTPAAAGGTLYRVPALIADIGEQAGWRYVEFFAANVRNPNTRRAYARACSRFSVGAKIGA